MQRGEMIHIWMIRYSDGTSECSSREYENVVKIAEEHVRGTGLSYVIIE